MEISPGAKHHRRGSVLLLTMIMMIVLLALVVVAIESVRNNMHVSTSQSDNAQALYLAEAGISKASYYLSNTAPDGSVGGTWRTISYPTACQHTPCSTSVFPTDPVTESLNGGTYTMWVVKAPSGLYINEVQIVSQGKYNGLTRTVQELATMTPLPGLEGGWIYNLGSGLTAPDSSGEGNNGTLHGSLAGNPTWTTGYLSGLGALSFNSSAEYVSISPAPNIVNSSFSITAWVKKARNGHYDFAYTQGTSGTGNQFEFGYTQYGTPDYFVCSFYNYGFSDSTTTTDFNWHHWACTFNASNNQMTLYKDGVQRNQATLGGQYSGNLSGYIGYDPNSEYFDGLISDMRFYDRVITSSEVQMVYSNSFYVNAVTGSWKECTLTKC